MPSKPRTRAPAKVSGRPAAAAATARGGAPAQERELRAQGQKTMRKLLDAGRYVFERRGFHAARVDDVVKRARTSHGTFYLYFSNKEDLFRALAIDALDEMSRLADEVPDVTPDADGRTALRDWVEHFVDVYTRHGIVVRAWSEGEIVDNELGPLGRELMTRLSSALGQHIDKAGGVPTGDAALAGIALLAMLERFNYFVQSRGIRFERDAAVDTLAAITYAGFFAGPELSRSAKAARG